LKNGEASLSKAKTENGAARGGVETIYSDVSSELGGIYILPTALFVNEPFSYPIFKAKSSGELNFTAASYANE